MGCVLQFGQHIKMSLAAAAVLVVVEVKVVVVVIVVVVVTHTFRSNTNWILFVPCKQKIYIFIQLVVKVCQKLVSVQLQLSDKKCFVKLQ